MTLLRFDVKLGVQLTKSRVWFSFELSSNLRRFLIEKG